MPCITADVSFAKMVDTEAPQIEAISNALIEKTDKVGQQRVAANSGAGPTGSRYEPASLSAEVLSQPSRQRIEVPDLDGAKIWVRVSILLIGALIFGFNPAWYQNSLTAQVLIPLGEGITGIYTLIKTIDYFTNSFSDNDEKEPHKRSAHFC